MISFLFAPLANLTHSKIKEISTPKAIIPKVAKVTKSIKGPHLRGRVKFKDRYFYAFCQDSIVILRGEHVEVLEEKGTSLIVKPITHT
ncbi:MAG: NfeD family protein [Thiotrichaceae bacterium]|nr:NfeD family protein [Thiotrichaceae bacterium]